MERLQACALDTVDQAMRAWLALSVSGKEQTFLPIATSFAAELMRPCFEKVDIGRYTERSRLQKEAEEYAVRLLDPRYNTLVPPRDNYAIATRLVARALVENYPTHDFAITAREAQAIGLPVEELTDEQRSVLHGLAMFLRNSTLTAIGRLEEVVDHGD
jgi:hypothetical protein